MKGIVTWYNIQRGYGFIKGIDGKDVFVHKSAVPFWTIFLKEGDKVEYKIENSKNGLKATSIKVL
jgi:CspA family cold shock protein